MRTFIARSSAPTDAAWPLLARPARWREWAPHLGGAWGLGAPEVRMGALGAARLLGALPVPARIVAKQPGRSWTWRGGAGALMAGGGGPGRDGPPRRAAPARGLRRGHRRHRARAARGGGGRRLRARDRRHAA